MELTNGSPWEAASFHGRSPELLFGRMFEDPRIELEAFPPRSRVFCIASAGCTARALAAAGHIVTAVDINPIQLAYAQSRADGGLVCEGAADRLIARGRSLLALLGWNERMRTSFLSMDSPVEQLDYWDRYLDSRLWRTAIDTLLSRTVLGLAYAQNFVASLKTRSFGPEMRARLRRGWASHPNRSNPYAWRMLLGHGCEEEPWFAVHPIRFVCADAAGFLESCSPGSFDAFSLSNIADGVSADYLDRLNRAVRRAATAEAVVVTRSFVEPVSEGLANLAARDRSLLWGSVNVAHALVRAASPLMATPADALHPTGCRDKSRHGTHECVRHIEDICSTF